MHSKTSRRTFVKGLAADGILGGFGLWRTPVWAVTSPGLPSVLTGNEFDLFIGETPVNITGSPRTAMTILDHIELAVRDAEASRRFYEQALAPLDIVRVITVGPERTRTGGTRHDGGSTPLA